jgi:hypothetical protein
VLSDPWFAASPIRHVPDHSSLITQHSSLKKAILENQEKPANLTESLFLGYNPSIVSNSRESSMESKSLRRLPLRQLLASSDKTTREVAELVHTHLLPRVVDFRDLSRPVRRKSQYPTMLAFVNGLRRMTEANDQLQALIAVLQEHLDTIREHAQREKLARKR